MLRSAGLIQASILFRAAAPTSRMAGPVSTVTVHGCPDHERYAPHYADATLGLVSHGHSRPGRGGSVPQAPDPVWGRVSGRHRPKVVS